ncbi:MAG: hypothetical protein HYU68_12300 [Bacteroidetes bacterium]|nr:hypothetical protein [Bacteroidota bacterium]
MFQISPYFIYSLWILALYSEKGQYYISPEDLNDELDMNMEIPLIYAALDKIYKDGFAQRIFKKRGEVRDEASPTYFISYNGIFTYKNGGYSEKFIRDDAKRRIQKIRDKKNDELTSELIKSTKAQKRFAFLIMIATIVTAVASIVNLAIYIMKEPTEQTLEELSPIIRQKVLKNNDTVRVEILNIDSSLTIVDPKLKP